MTVAEAMESTFARNAYLNKKAKIHQRAHVSFILIIINFIHQPLFNGKGESVPGPSTHNPGQSTTAPTPSLLVSPFNWLTPVPPAPVFPLAQSNPVPGLSTIPTPSQSEPVTSPPLSTARIPTSTQFKPVTTPSLSTGPLSVKAPAHSKAPAWYIDIPIYTPSATVPPLPKPSATVSFLPRQVPRPRSVPGPSSALPGPSVPRAAKAKAFSTMAVVSYCYQEYGFAVTSDINLLGEGAFSG